MNYACVKVYTNMVLACGKGPARPSPSGSISWPSFLLGFQEPCMGIEGGRVAYPIQRKLPRLQTIICICMNLTSHTELALQGELQAGCLFIVSVYLPMHSIRAHPRKGALPADMKS
jgi:hypothetical protein